MEKKKGTTTVFWSNMRVMEKKMETVVLQGLQEKNGGLDP